MPHAKAQIINLNQDKKICLTVLHSGGQFSIEVCSNEQIINNKSSKSSAGYRAGLIYTLHQIIDQISLSELINKTCPIFIESSTKCAQITKGKDKDSIMSKFLFHVEDTQGIDGLIALINHFSTHPYFKVAYPNFEKYSPHE